MNSLHFHMPRIVLFLVVTIGIKISFALDRAGQATKQCPSVCVCDGAEKFVICEEKHLFRIPSPLPTGTKLLGLPKNVFTSLSANSFQNLPINSTLESLILYDNTIKTISAYTFQQLANLKNLWLFGNKLTGLKANIFVGLSNLENLDLSRNQISTIESNAFVGLKNLQVLHLFGNLLVTLQPNSFYGLDHLANLTLGDNLFEEIPTEAFSNVKNLTSLEILNLPVEEIKADSFQSLNNLEKLHIGDWPLLKRIDSAAFSGLSALTYLSMYRCNLKSVPSEALSHLPSLKELQLSNNPQIKSIEREHFNDLHNLEHLFVSNISVHSLHESPFQLLTKLKSLDLSANKISALPSHIFLQLENLRFLNLSHNHLEVISQSVLLTLSKLNVLDLSGNNLICDCDIKWLKSLQEIKIREHFTLKGKCSDPIKYNGTDIVVLPPRKFICEAPLFSDDQKLVSVEAKVGRKAWLPCSPEQGVPSPKVTWRVPSGKTAEENKHSETLRNGTLYIEMVKPNDYGIYTCQAKNKFGNASNKVILEEIFHPILDSPKKKTSKVVTGVLVTCGVFLAIGIGVFFLYKRGWISQCRKSLYYDTLTGTSEVRLPMKNGWKMH